MRRLFAASLLTLPLLPFTTPAADDKPVVEDKKPAPVSTAVMVRLADGSNVKMSLTQSHLDVMTKFGKQTIPVHEIRTIEFALRYPPGVPEKIAAAAGRLANDDFKQREDAVAELLSFQELAYPTLQKLTKNSDKEVVRLANEMLTTLRDKLPEEKLKFRTQDSIATDAFTVVGLIQGKTLKAKSPFFGEVVLGMADLRGLRRASTDGMEKELTLDLSKYGVPQGIWLNTGIELNPDTVLEIRAGGESDLYPIGGERGAYRTNPSGSVQWGMSRDRKIPGRLLGRVGDKGKEFEIGERYDGAPGGEGKLYLRVGGSPWHNIPAGEYRVKITPK